MHINTSVYTGYIYSSVFSGLKGLRFVLLHLESQLVSRQQKTGSPSEALMDRLYRLDVDGDENHRKTIGKW